MRPPFRRELAVLTLLTFMAASDMLILYSYTASIKYGIRINISKYKAVTANPLLLVPQSLDRIKLCGTVCRIVPEENSNCH